MPVDPVCGMEADEREAITASHDDATYYFCSESCRDLFEADPERFLETPHPHLTESGGLRVPRLPYGRASGEFELHIQNPGELTEGDRVEFEKRITDDDVRKFAEATSDTNAVHLNDEFANGTRFQGRIVHGTLVSGLISAALACFPGLTIYLGQNLEFERPVRTGETLTATCEIVEVLENDRYRVTTRVENEDGKIVIHGTATVLVDPIPDELPAPEDSE